MTASTLELLEGNVWPEPEFQSHLAVTCHRLRKKPINEFTPEELRIMIGQSIGLRYLLPIAATLLESDAFVQGDMYEGDLLCSVMSSAESFVEKGSPLARQLLKIANAARSILNINPSTDEITTNLNQVLNCFISRHQ